MYRSPYARTIYIAFINNVLCTNRYLSDRYPYNLKFLYKHEQSTTNINLELSALEKVLETKITYW